MFLNLLTDKQNLIFLGAWTLDLKVYNKLFLQTFKGNALYTNCRGPQGLFWTHIFNKTIGVVLYLKQKHQYFWEFFWPNRG